MLFCIFETSTGWHFIDCFFREQTKHGPYATKEAATQGAYAMLAWHGMKCMFT
jgi:hypothetical protein